MVTLKIESSRVYFEGNTYSVKDQIKDIGGNWDKDRRAWWVGKVKLAAAQKLIESLGSPDGGQVEPKATETPEDRSMKRCLGKVKYKDRTYFVIGASNKTNRMYLTTLDCKIAFWAHTDQCEWLRRYEESHGDRYGKQTYPTVGSIRKFVERNKKEQETIKRGEIPAGYCVDMEDGMVKRRSECDMPSD